MGILRFASTAIKDATTAGRSWLTGTVSPSDVLLAADLDTPNNPPSLDSEGNLIGTFVQRTGTDSEINAITLQAGELAYTTDTLEIRIGDGTTPGGVFLSSSWRTISGDTTITSSTSLNDITDVVLPYKAGCRYSIKIEIGATDTGAASNWKFALAGTQTWYKPLDDGESNANYICNPLTWWSLQGDSVFESKMTAYQNVSFGGIAAKTITPVTASQTKIYLQAIAEVITGAVAGNFKLQAGQNTSSANSLGVAGRMSVQRII